MRWIIPLMYLPLVACGDNPSTASRSERTAEWKQYQAERKVAKICFDGSRVWVWRGKHYVYDGWQYPDAEISQPLETVCK